jgi:hypothetical protein
VPSDLTLPPEKTKPQLELVLPSPFRRPA